MKTDITKDVLVSVTSQYITTQVVDNIEHFVFSYTITIKNQHADSMQLLSRYWLITDGNGEESTVAGEGVVGQTPIIKTNEEFTYTSGCYLKTPVGTMQGHYLMIDSAKKSYQVEIPIFRLATPNTLN